MVIMTTLFHYMVPRFGQPSEWSVPLMPWPAAISIFLNVFLTTALKTMSFKRFAIWGCLITVFYVLYGVHSTYEAEEMEKETMDVNEVPNPSLQLTKLDV